MSVFVILSHLQSCDFCWIQYCDVCLCGKNAGRNALVCVQVCLIVYDVTSIKNPVLIF